MQSLVVGMFTKVSYASILTERVVGKPGGVKGLGKVSACERRPAS